MSNVHQESPLLPVVLLVDDARITADIDKSFFVSAGFRVLVATTLAEVLDLVASNSVDLMMIDVAFAKEQGLVVMREARKLSSRKEMKVLVTSLSGAAEMRAQAEKAGADGFLVKPAPRQKVLKEVKALTSQAVRDAERVRESLEVVLTWEGKKFAARSLDISEDGIHLVVEGKLPPVGTELHLEIVTGREAGSAVLVDGRVVRHTKEGFGVRFAELRRNEKRTLDKFLLAHSMESRASQYYL
jgi:two-component system chemotaxis response regulator CheY